MTASCIVAFPLYSLGQVLGKENRFQSLVKTTKDLSVVWDWEYSKGHFLENTVCYSMRLVMGFYLSDPAMLIIFLVL